MARVRLNDSDDDEAKIVKIGNYFIEKNTSIEFIESGAAVLDCTIGGGWPLTRIANIIGDESTGKTLLAIEACANFNRQYPKGEIFYRESESAFDEGYAEALGMPVDKVQFIDPDKFVTIEDLYDDLQRCVQQCIKRDTAGLYILDSLDALTSKEELERKFGEASYSLERAKQIGKLLRLCNSEVAKARMCLIVVSQTRDKINAAMFGKKKTRSGGRALDFFASQCLWLSHLDTINSSRGDIKRATGIRIRAKCEKNKISLPLRTCEFTITFGHGIDSLASSLDFLEDAKRLNEVTPLKRSAYNRSVSELDDDAYWQETERVNTIVKDVWREIDQLMLEGVRQKYRS